MTSATFYPHFTSQSISTSPEISTHTLTGPKNGPPLLLVHGFPQTHHIWHSVTPHLVDHFSLVLVDLRGYGESSKPKGSEEHKEYSKSTMVGFCVLFMFWWCVMGVSVCVFYGVGVMHIRRLFWIS